MNGTLIEEKVHDYPLDFGTFPVSIGRSGECGEPGRTNRDGYFSGTQDDIRIYNRGLNSGEVQQLYTATYRAQTTDCNPTNSAIHPLTPEVCDGVDNDCDGVVDDGVTTTYYQDSDGDGYGNSGVSTGACALPIGYTGDNTDCIDTNDQINPQTTRYLDSDSDGFANGSAVTQCYNPNASRRLSSELL